VDHDRQAALGGLREDAVQALVGDVEAFAARVELDADRAGCTRGSPPAP
jgi:hypothetical protein